MKEIIMEHKETGIKASNGDMIYYGDTVYLEGGAEWMGTREFQTTITIDDETIHDLELEWWDYCVILKRDSIKNDI